MQGTGKGETDSDGTGILGCDTITEVVGETVGAFKVEILILLKTLRFKL